MPDKPTVYRRYLPSKGVKASHTRVKALAALVLAAATIAPFSMSSDSDMTASASAAPPVMSQEQVRDVLSSRDTVRADRNEFRAPVTISDRGEQDYLRADVVHRQQDARAEAIAAEAAQVLAQAQAAAAQAAVLAAAKAAADATAAQAAAAAQAAEAAKATEAAKAAAIITLSTQGKGTPAAPNNPAPGAALPTSEYQAYALSKVGNDTEFGCLRNLWNKESGWNPNAQNSSSTAFGIAQFLDTTWAGVGVVKTSDGHQQIDAGLTYITRRYGAPCGAWAHSQALNWY